MTITYNKWKKYLLLIIVIISSIVAHNLIARVGWVKEFVGMNWLFENTGAKKIIAKKIKNAKIQNYRNTIKVKISGCVKRPGIYEVSRGTSLMELLEEQCGITGYADLRGLYNIILDDGEEYYIPYRKLRYGEKININTATEEELCRLPYVNRSIAREIIKYREKYGQFDTIEEIMEISGIGEKKFNYIKKHLKTGE